MSSDLSFWMDDDRQEDEMDRLEKGEGQPEEDAGDPELRKYEARRKITRMVIIRLIMCAMLVWTVICFEMPIAMRLLLGAVVVMILGTMVPVLMTLKTTLKYEDE